MVGSRAAAIDLDAAYAACARDARGHYENFPVASVLVPRHMRRDIAAVYAFARAADDFADEGNRSSSDRHRLLDGWRRRLHAAAASDTAGPPPLAGEPPNTVSIFLALGASIRRRGLPVALFDDLLSAFAQDVDVTSYGNWDDLLDYCRRSANPVGRLVLRIAGHDDDWLDEWSDAICTALQLTNFWQDIEIDRARGRNYLPQGETLHGAAWRTRALFAAGRPLCDAIRGRLRYELRATWLGGMRVLDRIERANFDMASRRPTLGAADACWLLGRLLTWRTA
jgi:hydroxysqualene synthase